MKSSTCKICFSFKLGCAYLEIFCAFSFPVEFSKGTSEIFGDEESKKNLKKKKKAKTRGTVFKLNVRHALFFCFKTCHLKLFSNMYF